MIKDLFVAIALGAVLGFGVTGGFFVISKSSKKTPIPTPTPIISVAPIKAETIPVEPSLPPINENLNIESPKNESVFSTSKITVKGTSKAGNIVVINTPTQTYNFTVDKTGTFSTDIELETGVNVLNISAIDSSDNQTDIQLFVTYSTSKF